jgi:glycosyltransferase involved in cell wall biosynthesis
MKILFIHPNMPGQFKHLARVFAADPTNTVVFITKPNRNEMRGVYKIPYDPGREPSASTHRYIVGFERGILQAQEVWRVCRNLKEKEGFTPDVIVAHPGWGDALYVKDAYPDVPLLNFFEFFYHSVGADVNFDPAEPSNFDDMARVRTKNAINLFSLQYCDWGLSPTRWQRHLHPKEYQHRITLIHDGVDTDISRPDSSVAYTTPAGMTFHKGDPVVTYIARNFEPYRGFPTFMQAAKTLLEERPDLHILAVGADGVSYGKKLPGNKTYRQVWAEKMGLTNHPRLHFVGTVPHEDLTKIFQLSRAHIYLTYPFVLSWSMLEAMATGCVLVGSATPPVEEVIQHGVNGFLVDFFSPDQLAKQVMEVLNTPNHCEEVRRAARKTVVDQYDLKKLLPMQIDLITDMSRGLIPPPAAKEIEAFYAEHAQNPAVKALEQKLRKVA